ncbi:MAG: hypothetical protein AAGG48_04305 [Planctomycetota bacterium]
MSIRVLLSAICLTGVVLDAGYCMAQQSYPSVSDVISRYDRNQDGRLSAKEVANGQYARQFPRWDSNRDGQVTAQEITVFRRRFGIAADGSLVANSKSFEIPTIDELERVDRNNRPSPQAARNSAFILKTQPHPSAGDQYIILTDHNEAGYLNALDRLAEHRQGSVVRVNDIASFSTNPDAMNRVRARLARAKFVAVAMRKDSFRENTLLALWELFATIDSDPQLDVQPGLLLASDPASFAKLIDQSIKFESVSVEQLRPIAISQVQRAAETRSLQKAGIVRKVFSDYERTTPVVAIYGQQANTAPKLEGDPVWNLTTSGQRSFVTTFPESVSTALQNANLWILHGHGIPGMSCSVDVDALPDDLSGKILLSGSCFSAAPWQSDLPKLREAPGGYQVEQRDAFVIRAVDHGAVVAFGHQRLSSGFPHLYPILESWMKGQTVGESYQQLLNGLIEMQQLGGGGFVIRNAQKGSKRLKQNQLLYVLIGDPAIQPLEPMH